jgi:phosphoribosylaminoimidazolecarboxamide formyltransferase/IMP cyclohydrolase
MPRALLSVSDKTGIVELARGLAARGFEMVSTGGTARALQDAGLAVAAVSDVTGFPEMMDGRVKTLHPGIHGGILARRDRPDDLAAARARGIGLIDLVVVNLYPFARTAAKPGVSFEELVDEIDIGGPSMVRAAAKNFRDVLIVVDPSDYPRLLEEIDKGPNVAFRFELMKKAFAHTGEYDSTIAASLFTVGFDGRRFEPKPLSQLSSDEATLELSLVKVRDLRYGENPHQRAAWYRGAGPEQSNAGFGHATVHQGRELSYTNLLDLDAAVRIVLEFDEPAAAVVKHTNPCGAAVGMSAAEAYVRARDADSLAAFGGIVALNRPIDAAAAEAIVSTFIEAVIAPSLDQAALAVLARKANLRVVTGDFALFNRDDFVWGDVEVRSILGAVLSQQRDRVVEARSPWDAGRTLSGPPQGANPDPPRVVTKRVPTAEEWSALRFAWRICAHVKSNTVVFTNQRRTLAVGAGQMSRVDAVNVAVMKARASNCSLGGAVAASDAFFPFRDGLDAVAEAGASAVVQPGGSVRDAEVIAAADEHGLAMVFTGKRHFRH